MRLVCLHASPLSRGAKIVQMDTVRVKLFLYSGYENISHKAASHLFRLLQRYNCSLEDPTRYRDRWAAFWPSINPLERQLLSLLIISNADGVFGRRLEVTDPPVDFEPLHGLLDSAVFFPEIEQEFRRLLTDYFRYLISPDDIAACWLADCKVQLNGQSIDPLLALLFSPEVGLHVDLFMEKGAALLAGDLPDSDLAVRLERLAESLTNLVRQKEHQLWSAC